MRSGRIIRAIAGFFDVDCGEGEVYRCKAKGIFREAGIRPMVGDYVTFDITHEGDAEGNVTEIVKRRNTLIRPMVANVDQALILFAVKSPDPNLLLLDKFLIMMQRQDVPVLICFNKTDLKNVEEREAELSDTYCGSGAQTFFFSVKTGEGLSDLIEALRDKTTVFAGPSGVGKSSLLNALCPSASMETGELSKKTARGKNTTRHSELFHAAEGMFHECKETFFMDTPGFTALDLRDVTPRGLHAYYNEFTPYAGDCAFSDCVHINEPSCAVKEAIEKGEIPRVRYDTYRLLHDELSGRREVYIKK